MFETETVGPCLVQKLKWGGHGPPAPQMATPLKSLTLLMSLKTWFLLGKSWNVELEFILFNCFHNTKQMPEILSFKVEMLFKFQNAMDIKIIGF